MFFVWCIRISSYGVPLPHRPSVKCGSADVQTCNMRIDIVEIICGHDYTGRAKACDAYADIGQL